MWNVAHIIYRAMCGDKGPDTIYFTVHLRECDRSIKTVGRKMLAGKTRRMYSRALRENVLECLAYDPEDRPPAAILLQRIQAELQRYNNPATRDNPPDWPDPDEPDLKGEDGYDGGRRSAAPLDHPPYMDYNDEEDESDYDGTQLLFPCKSDLRNGRREMPFEQETIRPPWPQTYTDFRKSFFVPGWDERGRRVQIGNDNSSLSAQSGNSHITISSNEDDSDGDDDRPDSSRRRRVYENRIESVRSRPGRPERSNRGERVMKRPRRQPPPRGNGNEGLRRSSRSAQADRANQPAAPPPERRPGAEIAQDSVFARPQARNVPPGHRYGSSAARARFARDEKAFAEAEDLPDYEEVAAPFQGRQ
jgi:hypothetical protein